MILQIPTSEKLYEIPLASKSASTFSIVFQENIILAFEGLFLYMKDQNIKFPTKIIEKILEQFPTFVPKSILKPSRTTLMNPPTAFSTNSEQKHQRDYNKRDTMTLYNSTTNVPDINNQLIFETSMNVQKSSDSPTLPQDSREFYDDLTVRTNKSIITNLDGIAEFECDLVNGKKEGYGRWIHKNGKIKYEGEF